MSLPQKEFQPDGVYLRELMTTISRALVARRAQEREAQLQSTCDQACRGLLKRAAVSRYFLKDYLFCTICFEAAGKHVNKPAACEHAARWDVPPLGAAKITFLIRP